MIAASLIIHTELTTVNINFDLDITTTDELLDEPTFILEELAGEFDTDDYEYQQSTQY